MKRENATTYQNKVTEKPDFDPPLPVSDMVTCLYVPSSSEILSNQVPVERFFVLRLKMYWLLPKSYLNMSPVVAALVETVSISSPDTVSVIFFRLSLATAVET